MTTQIETQPSHARMCLADRIYPQASALQTEGKSQNEIAKLLGVSPATVGRSLMRGRGTPAGVREVREQPQVLYRMYDQAGSLLYVGISLSPMGRFKHHSHSQPWWSDVARIELAHVQTREQVMEAERVAVRDENPMHNIRLAGSRTERSEEELRRLVEAGRKGGAKSGEVRRARTMARIAEVFAHEAAR